MELSIFRNSFTTQHESQTIKNLQIVKTKSPSKRALINENSEVFLIIFQLRKRNSIFEREI